MHSDFPLCIILKMQKKKTNPESVIPFAFIMANSDADKNVKKIRDMAIDKVEICSYLFNAFFKMQLL